jgi:tetratricopeptide (TPR) repeat protein
MNTSISEQKNLANELRKNGNFNKAIPLYESLWRETSDPFDGTGLLCCYRKCGAFDKAIPLANELIMKNIGMTWTAREICWTLVQGRLQIFDESTPLEEVIKIAETILKYSPDFLALKVAVFYVLKLAKRKEEWDIVGSWIDRIEPNKLSSVPIQLSSGRMGWSDLDLWYNYKINYLLRKKTFNEAKEIAIIAVEKCPKQRLFFLRLQAQAMIGLGEIENGKRMYEDLCKGKRKEWWILHEYGNFLKTQGDIEEALRLLCTAALLNSKLEMMVKLYSDLAEIFITKGDLEKAQKHYYLEKFVREENGWPVSTNLAASIEKINSKIGRNAEPHSKQEMLLCCRKLWNGVCGTVGTDSKSNNKDLVGKLTIPNKKPFCFVKTKDGLSAICYLKDLPDDMEDGAIVKFNLIPSFDKKKNKESWRAIKVRKCILGKD